MIHLMKLELQKVSVKKYILFSVIGILAGMFFVFVGLNDTSTSIYDYEVTFRMIGIFFCFYYITLFAVMVVAYIINEYNHRTILVMFSYPVNRKKMILAKLLLITLFVLFSMMIGYICCGGFIILVDKYLNLVIGDFEISVLSCWIPNAIKSMLTFCAFGIGTFVAGMMKKSISMTIISAIVFCYIRQFFLAGTNTTDESWLFVMGVAAVMIVGVYYVLNHKVKQVE